ncbi:hypothetical protein [Vibrio cholerae]|uniref:hypothetical protein n=1 Tax=Vibrio cholerae TaxID=666 RepID=UPI0016521446|nr:hypothetical protein [Vibrio cholerae]
MRFKPSLHKALNPISTKVCFQITRIEILQKQPKSLKNAFQPNRTTRSRSNPSIPYRTKPRPIFSGQFPSIPYVSFYVVGYILLLKVKLGKPFAVTKSSILYGMVKLESLPITAWIGRKGIK